MKKVFRVILGIGVVVLVANVIKQALEKPAEETTEEVDVLAHNWSEAYFYWLSNVWEDFNNLNGAVHDRRTFSDPMWELGLRDAIHALHRTLGKFPKEIMAKAGLNIEFCETHISNIDTRLGELSKLLYGKERRGMKDHASDIGISLHDLNWAGRRARPEWTNWP